MRPTGSSFAVRAAGFALFLVSLSNGAAALPRGEEQIESQYRVDRSVPYRVVGDRTLTADVYSKLPSSKSVPVMYYIHGGGWSHGTKTTELVYIHPWLKMGWDVVSVEYRLTDAACAPAAVEDCSCGYQWLAQQAGKYHFDLNHVVVCGASAGGNLALLVGMAPPQSEFARGCPGPRPKTAAIVSIAGITDVADLLSGPNRREFAVQWVGRRADADLARRVSPLSYVAPGLPPILLVHGDADRTVPYEQALRLQADLRQAGVPHRLLTIPGAGHGGWKPEELAMITRTIGEFLTEHSLSVAHP
jgi:acetyl esterase/lipase